jgi:hypothetical protein
MGKASSAKKVARAARAGGRVSSGQPRSLLFPSVLAAVVVLGLTLVVYAREDRRNDDLGGTPQLGDHIHQALGINVCGEFLPDVPEFESSIGIHTHGDGVIHIHPFSQLGVGANATLERYFKDAREAGLDLSLTSSKLTYLDETYEEGETECEGVDDPVLRLAYWEDVQGSDEDPQVTTGDFTDLRLTTNGGGITIFYGDEDADIPKPPKSNQLAELGAADGGQTPDAEGNTTTTTPDDESTTSTTAGEPSGATTTTAGESAPTTSAP